MIYIKYEALHPTAVSKNDSSKLGIKVVVWLNVYGVEVVFVMFKMQDVILYS